MRRRRDWNRAAGLEVAAVDDVARLDDPGQILFDLCNRMRAQAACSPRAASAAARLALRADLRSRLASGIVLQLHPLSDGERPTALRRHAAGRGIALDAELIRYLLSHFDRDMGTQIAALDAVDRYSLQRSARIHAASAEEPACLGARRADQRTLTAHSIVTAAPGAACTSAQERHAVRPAACSERSRFFSRAA